MYIIDADAHPPIEAMDIDYLGRFTPQDFFDRIARTGAEVVWGVPSLPEGVPAPSAGRLMNIATDALSMSVLLKGRWIPAIWVHPGDAHFCRGLIVEYRSRGVAACGDIQPQWLEEDSEGLHVLLDTAERYDMAVFFAGGKPELLQRVAERYPKLTMLVRGVSVLPAIELLNACPNIHLITTGINVANYQLHNLLEKMPADRVLYGSGYPYCNPGYQKGSIDWELRDTAADVRAAVMGENALRLSTKGGINA